MSQFISLELAADMTTRFRNNRNTILQSSYQNQNILCICETFDRSAFDTILAQTGCASVRIYYGMDENLKVHAIIVAADEEGHDILPGSTANFIDPEEDESIIETGVRCPESCPPESDLNS